MANTLTIQRINRAQGALRVSGTIVLSGSYAVAPVGEILDFTKAVFAQGSGMAAGFLPVSKGPVSMDIWGNIGVSYEPIGPTPIAALQVPMKITASTISGSTPTVNELAAGAYNALLIADNIQFEAVFDSLL